MPSLCLKGFGLAAWQKAVKNSPQLSLGLSHASVEPRLSLPSHPTEHADKPFHLPFWKWPQPKARMGRIFCFSQKLAMQKNGCCNLNVCSILQLDKEAAQTQSGCYLRINIWTEGGSSGTLLMCHWQLSQCQNELEIVLLRCTCSHILSQLRIQKVFVSSSSVPIILIILCSQKEVGTPSTNLQILPKLGIMVIAVLWEIFFFKTFCKKTQPKSYTNTFSLQRPILQGNTGRNIACTGLSFAIFSFSKVFCISLKIYLWCSKSISTGLFTVGFFYLVTMLSKKIYMLHFFNFLRPQECNENHDARYTKIL